MRKQKEAKRRSVVAEAPSEWSDLSSCYLGIVCVRGVNEFVIMRADTRRGQRGQGGGGQSNQQQKVSVMQVGLITSELLKHHVLGNRWAGDRETAGGAALRSIE